MSVLWWPLILTAQKRNNSKNTTLQDWKRQPQGQAALDDREAHWVWRHTRDNYKQPTNTEGAPLSIRFFTVADSEYLGTCEAIQVHSCIYWSRHKHSRYICILQSTFDIGVSWTLPTTSCLCSCFAGLLLNPADIPDYSGDEGLKNRPVPMVVLGLQEREMDYKMPTYSYVSQSNWIVWDGNCLHYHHHTTITLRHHRKQHLHRHYHHQPKQGWIIDGGYHGFGRHVVLKRMVDMGIVKAVVTSNHDNLHQKAGLVTSQSPSPLSSYSCYHNHQRVSRSPSLNNKQVWTALKWSICTVTFTSKNVASAKNCGLERWLCLLCQGCATIPPVGEGFLKQVSRCSPSPHSISTLWYNLVNHQALVV